MYAGLQVSVFQYSNHQSKWYTKNVNPIWPSNQGFNGKPSSITLKPGTLVDRYGYDSGTFVSPVGTPYTNRSLPKGTDLKPYTVYEVLKPIEVLYGKIAPWFGENGGGIQYKFKSNIEYLIKEEILRKVVK